MPTPTPSPSSTRALEPRPPSPRRRAVRTGGESVPRRGRGVWRAGSHGSLLFLWTGAPVGPGLQLNAGALGGLRSLDTRGKCLRRWGRSPFGAPVPHDHPAGGRGLRSGAGPGRAAEEWGARRSVLQVAVPAQGPLRRKGGAGGGLRGAARPAAAPGARAPRPRPGPARRTAPRARPRQSLPPLPPSSIWARPGSRRRLSDLGEAGRQGVEPGARGGEHGRPSRAHPRGSLRLPARAAPVVGPVTRSGGAE